MASMKNTKTRHLVFILGDQLDEASTAFDGFDPKQDVVLMVEAFEESTHVWSHKIRTALFLSAMRHFAESLKQRGWPVDYRAMDKHGDKTLADGLLAEHRVLAGRSSRHQAPNSCRNTYGRIPPAR